MAGATSIENGKKGGRPKAAHTILAEKAKQELIQAYMAHIKPINAALVKKATEGDIQAIKELHDRVYGRAAQPIVGDPDKPILLQITGMRVVKE